MIEYDISDEDALWDISERIGRERLEPDTLDPAEIEESPAGSPPSSPNTHSAFAPSSKL